MNSFPFLKIKNLVRVCFLSFIILLSSQQILAESKCKSDNSFFSIFDLSGLFRLFNTLDIDDENTISKEKEPYAYVSEALKKRSFDVEVLLEKLNDLALQDRDCFIEIASHINNDNELIKILTKATQNNLYQRVKLFLIRNSVPLTNTNNDELDGDFERLFNHIYIGDSVLKESRNEFSLKSNPREDDNNSVTFFYENLRRDLVSLKNKFPMISDVLRIVSVHAKKNPHMRIVLGHDDEILDSKFNGTYIDLYTSLLLITDVESISNKFLSHWIDSLISALTLFAMDILYKNSGAPFYNCQVTFIYLERVRCRSFQAAVHAHHEALVKNSRYLHHVEKALAEKITRVKSCLLDHAFFKFMTTGYLADELNIRSYIPSTVGLFPYIESHDVERDPLDVTRAIKDIQEPLLKYWQNYIKPDVDKYLSQNSEK